MKTANVKCATIDCAGKRAKRYSNGLYKCLSCGRFSVIKYEVRDMWGHDLCDGYTYRTKAGAWRAAAKRGYAECHTLGPEVVAVRVYLPDVAGQ